MQLTGSANGAAFAVAANIDNIQLKVNQGQIETEITEDSVEEVVAEAQQTAVTIDFAGGNDAGDTYSITLGAGDEQITAELCNCR